jgi:hypothetical protein
MVDDPSDWEKRHLETRYANNQGMGCGRGVLMSDLVSNSEL